MAPTGVFPPLEWFQPEPAAAPAPTMIPAAVAAQGPPPPDIPAAAPPGAPAQTPELPQPGQAPGFDVQLDAPVPPAGVFPGVLFSQPPAAPQGVDPAADQANVEAGRGLAAQGPEAVAEQGATLELRKEDYVAGQFLDEERRTRQTQEKNLLRWRTDEADLQKERIALRTEAAELAKVGVNNDHWWESRSTGQKIAAYVSAIAGGLVAPYNGGRNSGLDLITGAIERDIQTQKDNLAHRGNVLAQRRGILGELAQANNDALRSEETMRLAAFENVAQRLQAEAARLDPRGSAAQRIATALQNVRAEQDRLAVAADERLFNRKKDMFDMRIREETLTEQRRARQAQLAEQRRSRQEQTSQQTKARDAEMLTKGFVPDATAPGGYKPDPNRPAQQDPQSALATGRLVKLEEEIQHAKEARTVQFRGKEIGKALSEQDGANMRQRVAAYERYQTEITELENMLSNPDGSTKTFYQGPGWELVKNPERDAVMAKALNVLYLQAKINDPSTGVRDAEIKFGQAIVPFVQGLTSGRSPAAQAEAIRHQADTDLASHIDQEIIGGLAGLPKGQNPVESWKATRAAMSAARTEAQAADTPQKSLDVLTAPMAENTPPEARGAFVQTKLALIDRWAADNPWLLDQVDLKKAWADDKSLTPTEKGTLLKALEEAQVKAIVNKQRRGPMGQYYEQARGNSLPTEEGDE